MSEILKNSASLEVKSNNSNPTKKSVEYFKGKLCSLLVPSGLLFDTKLGEWYETNEYHKFQTGDILIFKDETMVGYKKRTVGLVKGFFMKEENKKQIGQYEIELISDSKRPRYLSFDSDSDCREMRVVSVSKLGIESLFKKVAAENVDEALNFYR